MDDSPSPSSPSSQPRTGWLERLTQILTGEPRSRDELIETLESAQERGVLEQGALKMIVGVLDLHELRARDIMIPRGQMDVLEQDAPFDAILGAVLESGHSRYPVIGENRDEVVGILLAKDMLHAIPCPREKEDEADGLESGFDLSVFLRPALFVPESMRLEALLTELRASRNHMALVIDEYGGIAGLVTIEDILEQIVGDIDDEHDVEEDERIRAAGSDRYIVHAQTPIDEFNETVGANLSDEDFDTIGGLVTHALGHLPERGEVTTLEGFEFKVVSVDRRRLHRLRVTRLAPSDTCDDGR